MQKIFKELILDFHRREIPRPSPRALQLAKLPVGVRKVYVLVGMRRSGKTWCLYQHMHSLLAQGINKEKILYLNFSDDRLFNVKIQDLKLILEAYFELYPQYVDDNDLHFFFDEIHEVLHWENFIRRLLDVEKMALYISGSSAKMLSKEVATSLRGRVFLKEVFPFSFTEYLHYHHVTPALNLAAKDKAIMKKNLADFLYHGGFPESVILRSYSVFPVTFPLRFIQSDALNGEFCELLQSYIESVIYRDIIERHKIKNIMVVKALLLTCLKNSAHLFSVHKEYNDLKSQGYAVSKNSLYKYVGYFADAFCIFAVPLYNKSYRKMHNASKKIYLVDQGLITAYTIKDNDEHSARLETAVFLHLRRSENEVYYYRTRDNKEVDFLTCAVNKNLALYQVTVSLKDQKTRQRELLALRQAMAELKVSNATIVTLDEDEKQKIDVPQGCISCISLWQLLVS